MELNWYILGGIALLAIVLVIFLIKKNNDDEKELETFLNNDFEIENKEDKELNDPN